MRRPMVAGQPADLPTVQRRQLINGLRHLALPSGVDVAGIPALLVYQSSD
ncbi:hypothetical protein ACXX9E_28665 [Pseudomonas sp. GNP014]